MRALLSGVVAGLALLASAPLVRTAQDGPPAEADALHQSLDDVLDLYVRDGLVYYRALQSDRARLDRYVVFLGEPETEAAHRRWTRDEQMAFWLNAYNAIVLRTVIDHYPIRGPAPAYPSSSVRQVPGAFERLTYRVAGRSVTLDEIEYEVLAAFGDPRLSLALGRGALGSPRLRSEAFTGARLSAQLSRVEAECPTRRECLSVDVAANRIAVTSVVGWHEREFVTAYADRDARFPERSAIERAVLAFIDPHVLRTEREFLARRQFAMVYTEFDWTLNDLTGRS